MATNSYLPTLIPDPGQGSIGQSTKSRDTGQFSQYSWANADEKDLYYKWANLYSEYHQGFENNFFDYYFSGQDIQIYIDGLMTPADMLPIYNFGYAIQQEKRPVYGFWSYVYDYMLRGTRIVSGAFTVLSITPGFVRDKVAKAASVRSSSAGRANVLFPIRGLDGDEANIEKYWRRNYDSNLDVGQNHLFSIHPPFNFIIVYGIQDTSLRLNTSAERSAEIRSKFQNSTAMMSDINERLVEVDPDDNKMRILLENVELGSRQTEYNADGDPVGETYTFTARDMREAPISRITTGNTLIPGNPR